MIAGTSFRTRTVLAFDGCASTMAPPTSSPDSVTISRKASASRLCWSRWVCDSACQAAGLLWISAMYFTRRSFPSFRISHDEVEAGYAFSTSHENHHLGVETVDIAPTSLQTYA